MLSARCYHLVLPTVGRTLDALACNENFTINLHCQSQLKNVDSSRIWTCTFRILVCHSTWVLTAIWLECLINHHEGVGLILIWGSEIIFSKFELSKCPTVFHEYLLTPICKSSVLQSVVAYLIKEHGSFPWQVKLSGVSQSTCKTKECTLLPTVGGAGQWCPTLKKYLISDKKTSSDLFFT